MKNVTIYLLLFFSLLTQATRAKSMFKPMPEAIQAMKTDDLINVKEIKVDTWLVANSYYLFSPKHNLNSAKTAFIFYPGARVDVRAYAKTLRSIAKRGHRVFALRMPLDFALLGVGRAGHIIADYPDIKSWAVGGHSLGGVAAASFAYKNLTDIDALILWASYPSNSSDLSLTQLPTLSLFGERDGLTQISEIEESKLLLPASTSFIEILGANHTQFGSYGDGSPQKRDLMPTISREKQQKTISRETTNFLNSI